MPAIIASCAVRLRFRAEIGELKAGKYADLVLVDGDPLTDPGALQRVKMVVKGGEIVFRPEQP